MTKNLEIYRCNRCGNIVEVIKGNGAPMVCCGENMELLEAKTADTSVEKHVPYIEEIEDGYKVRIGENQNHPMMEKHYIQWVELIVGSRVYRKEFTYNGTPEVTFKVEKADKVVAREYCNLHGLWEETL
ncbi:desulfoferrodoxin [Oceanirhabdus sp. W0125-5]|uniref:desulfoferrodoxin n=1 Tax=Oceanirhabdus sp. W0125-5 TaxID=2999116 RepID=UPI0022F33A91|nr:desulfoferrodoxin [Oceanirhabdus sp. W0125-5]WBW95530.1 desulfoferrodoxin [Oceanirhabdus sp. W0125-5]